MKNSKIKMLSKFKIFLLGLIIAIIYWITESLIDTYIIFPGNQFLSHLFNPEPHELWMRSIPTIFIIIFSFILNYLYVLEKRKEQELTHVSSILKAVRNVNQIIVREKRKKPLLKKVCQRLIETRGFLSAWIALFDEEGNLTLTSEAGIGDSFNLLKRELEKNNYPNCYTKTISETKAIIIKETKTFCRECPISHLYQKRAVISSPLRYENNNYGILTVSLPKKMANIKEEKDLFEEVSDDIAFALYNIELEKTQVRIRKHLKRALNKSDFYKDLLAHDMGNILNNLKSSNQLMEILNKDPNQHEDMKELKEIVKNQIERGISLIKNIRKLSKIEEGRERKKVIELNHILNEAVNSLKSQERPVEIYSDFHRRDYYIMGGELLLDAFENILLNGIMHNENTNVKLWINLSELKQGGENYVKIEFKDNGIGIPDESKQIIFTKSYKREKATVGMGIGLSLVNEIISEYGGNIWVEDRVKGDYTQGTNLVLLLKKA